MLKKIHGRNKKEIKKIMSFTEKKSKKYCINKINTIEEGINTKK